MSAAALPQLTFDAYLEWENRQETRNEFHRGEVFAMVGARRVHGCVVGNLGRHLGNHLAGTSCRAFVDSMKVQIGDDTILYPDVFVTCDKADLSTDLIFRSPMLIVEVLSPTTQSYGRSQKFALYRRIEALREYVLVDPDARRVESFRRNAGGEWVFHDMSTDAALDLPAIGCRIALTDVFDGIDDGRGEAAV